MTKSTNSKTTVIVAGKAITPRKIRKVNKVNVVAEIPAVEAAPVVATEAPVAEAPVAEAPKEAVLTVEEIKDLPAESCWDGRKISKEVWRGLKDQHSALPGSVLYLLKGGLGWEEALREGCKNPHIKSNLLALQGKNEFDSFWSWMVNPISPTGRKLSEAEAKQRIFELWQKASFSPNAWRCLRANVMWQIGALLYPNKPRLVPFAHAQNIARVRSRLIAIHG